MRGEYINGKDIVQTVVQWKVGHQQKLGKINITGLTVSLNYVSRQLIGDRP